MFVPVDLQSFVPVDLQSTGWLMAGLRPARIGNPLITVSGIANPRGPCKTILCRGLACLSPECTGWADTRSTPTGNTQGVAHVLMSSASVRLSLWICKSPKTQDTRTQNPLIIKSWIRRSATAGECTLLTSSCLY